MKELFEKDQWLSYCLDVNCYNLNVERGVTFDSIVVDTPLFITAKVSFLDQKLYENLLKIGFREINKQVTFRKALKQLSTQSMSAQSLSIPAGYRLEIKSYLSAIDEFSGLFAFDRFSTDPELPSNWSISIKKRWMESVESSKRYILAYVQDKIAGFILFRKGSDYVIELVCVLKEFRGRKLAQLMLSFLQREAVADYASNIIVGTQEDNSNSLHVYRSFGFLKTHEKRVLHYSRGLELND